MYASGAMLHPGSHLPSSHDGIERAATLDLYSPSHALASLYNLKATSLPSFKLRLEVSLLCSRCSFQLQSLLLNSRFARSVHFSMAASTPDLKHRSVHGWLIIYLLVSWLTISLAPHKELFRPYQTAEYR